jgi:hypothetical protein
MAAHLFTKKLLDLCWYGETNIGWDQSIAQSMALVFALRNCSRKILRMAVMRPVQTHAGRQKYGLFSSVEGKAGAHEITG